MNRNPAATKTLAKMMMRTETVIKKKLLVGPKQWGHVSTLNPRTCPCRTKTATDQATLTTGFCSKPSKSFAVPEG